MTKENPKVFSEEGYRNYPHHKEGIKLKIKNCINNCLILSNCLLLLSPIILTAFFYKKLITFDCIDTTNKIWMILVSFFLFAYVIKNYLDYWEKIK